MVSVDIVLHPVGYTDGWFDRYRITSHEASHGLTTDSILEYELLVCAACGCAHEHADEEPPHPANEVAAQRDEES